MSMKFLQIPDIRRVRAYRIYTSDNRRLVDLFLEDGAALMGHKPQNWSQRYKDVHQKCGLSSYPHSVHSRIKKHLSIVFPQYKYFYFIDPVTKETHYSELPLVRPFEVGAQGSPTFLKVPAPGFQHISVIGSVEEIGDVDEFLYPVVILSAAVKSISRWSSFLEIYNEALWSQWDSNLFERKGPYLYYKGTETEYTKLFQQFLEKGFLLNPQFDAPSIVPAEFSSGELSQFLKVGELL